MNSAAQLILAIRLECFLDGMHAPMPGEHWAFVKTLEHRPGCVVAIVSRSEGGGYLANTRR